CRGGHDLAPMQASYRTSGSLGRRARRAARARMSSNDTHEVRRRNATSAIRALLPRCGTSHTGTYIALTTPAMPTMNRRPLHSGFVALTILCFGGPAGAGIAAEHRDIELWVRGDGKMSGGEAPRQRSERVTLDTLPLVNSVRFDPQYD